MPALREAMMTMMKKDAVQWIKSHPDCFTDLVQLSMADEQPYSKRAAYLLWDCIDPNDPRIEKKFKMIWKKLPELTDSQQWNLLKVLSMLKVPEELKGPIFDYCLLMFMDHNRSPALRYNACKWLFELAKEEPELFHEIKNVLQSPYTDSLTRGVKHSVMKMLNSCEKRRQKKVPSKEGT